MKLVSAHQLLRQVRPNIERIAQGGRATVERERGPVTCRPGCAFCCHQKILVTLGEGALMYLHLKEAGAWSEALEAKLVEADKEMTRHRHAEWLKLRRPCVMLVEESPGVGRCSIYETRPLSCAQTFSTNPDPHSCWEVGGKEYVMVSNPSTEAWHLHVTHQLSRSMHIDKHLALTLPGSVLLARALIEGRRLPAVHSVAFEDIAGGPLTMTQVFDATGRRR